ncbi:ferredoxin [Primorskyibacter sp. 2E233]|uniref:ferredoxin n=1 Tax=Primorskyibacter sp. 2E233 TaxID=3413431 RepID=UPI003BEF5DBD
MTTLHRLNEHAQEFGLRLRGALHPDKADVAPDGCETLILLGPDEPAFWAIFNASSEYTDGAADPLDRWSQRVLGHLARDWGGTAIFPSDGPPYPPFIRWADRSGQAWPSPVGLLVHDAAGLFISYRGAIALPERVELDPRGARPCDTCPQPCTSACPVGALRPGKPYDVPVCMAHLRSPDGTACRDGCLVRRACPVVRAFQRLPEQSAFHMDAFLGEWRP